MKKLFEKAVENAGAICGGIVFATGVVVDIIRRRSGTTVPTADAEINNLVDDIVSEL